MEEGFSPVVDLEFVVSELTGSLTEDQLNSVMHKRDNLQIIAAAGSGKTKTLVSLILHEIALGVKPSEIIVFTFTQKAAGELLTRILSSAQKLFPNHDFDGMYIGTIHGWCLKYLENQLNISNFLILDELHIKSLILRLYDSIGVEEYSNQKYPLGSEVFLGDMEIIWNEGTKRIDTRSSVEAFIKFQELLKNNRMMSYGEMLIKTLDILKSDANFSCKLLCIDEYQDVNNIQVDLAQTMVSKGARVVAVGDHRQSIYQWRGSNPERLLQMKDDFPNVKEHRLRKNFRSDSSIVKLANRFATDFLGDSSEDAMLASRNSFDHERVIHIEVSHQKEQAIAIAESLLDLHEKGVKWSDCAILMRSLRHGSHEIIEELNARGIPVGGPGANKGIYFVETVFLPILEWLILASDKRETQEYLDLMEKASSDLESTLNLEGQGLNDFWEAINIWLEKILKNNNESYDIRSGLYSFLEQAKILVSLEEEAIINGIAILSQFMRSIEEIYRRRIPGINRRRVLGILKELKYSIQRDLYSYGETIPVELDSERVILSTVHQAKGLEWNVVFMPNLNQGLMPLRSRPRVTKIDGHYSASYGTTLKEEARLFYVGITRARELLVLLSVKGSRSKDSVFKNSLKSAGVQSINLDGFDRSIQTLKIEDWDSSQGEYLRIGISDLLMFLECPFEYGLRKRAGIQPAIGQELGFGQGLHEVLRRRLEVAEDWDLEKFEELARELVWLPYMSESDEKNNQSRIAEMALNIQNLELLKGKQKTELDIDLVWNHALLQGSIDGVVEETDGSVLIRDWKSNIHEEFVERYDRQLKLYALALEQKDLVVNAAEYIDVAASSKQGQVVKKDVDISSKSKNDMRSSVEVAIIGISDGRFPPTPSKQSCGSCDISSICAYKEVDAK
jgi:DNA helicase II / ATP-dependent DNA helicase PcrA